VLLFVSFILSVDLMQKNLEKKLDVLLLFVRTFYAV